MFSAGPSNRHWDVHKSICFLFFWINFIFRLFGNCTNVASLYCATNYYSCFFFFFALDFDFKLLSYHYMPNVPFTQHYMRVDMVIV